jgi:hypothetical protein
MGKLHPYTVHAVGRVDGKLRDNHAVSPMKHVIAVFHGQASQIHGIRQHFQIGVPGIMPLKKTSQRITRFLRQILIFKIRTGIMAGN